MAIIVTTPASPVAAPPAGFDQDQVRAGLHEAMAFGMPARVEERLTFEFPATETWVDASGNPVAVDGSGKPFDRAATRRSVVSRPPVTGVLYAVEYMDATGAPTQGFGEVTVSYLRVTLLDDAYAQVQGCSSVLVAGDRYAYAHTEPPLSMAGQIGVYVMRFNAVNER